MTCCSEINTIPRHEFLEVNQLCITESLLNMIPQHRYSHILSFVYVILMFGKGNIQSATFFIKSTFNSIHFGIHLTAASPLFLTRLQQSSHAFLYAEHKCSLWSRLDKHHCIAQASFAHSFCSGGASFF